MASHSPYPIFLDLLRAPVLIVGGGNVGLRKARGLLPSAARVTVVSPEFHRDFSELRDIEKVHAPYVATHMSRKMWRLVFAATNSRQVNDLVQKHAATHSILCCRCDEPELGDFSGGAAWTSANAHVILAVGTTGASPVLAARIRSAAAASVDPLLAEWAELLATWRPLVKHKVDDPALRRALLSVLAGEEMESALRQNGRAAALALFEKWLAAARASSLTLAPSSRKSSPHDTVDHAD